MVAAKGRMRQIVFAFDEGSKDTLAPEIRGGKGSHLAEMVAMGLPVPPGFTITTTVARSFMEHGRLPRRYDFHFNRGIKNLERATGKKLGDPSNPLLVSVRSGAAVSMPGMMDTVLNIGLTPAVTVGLARIAGERFAWDTYRRFLSLFGQVVMGVPGEYFERILCRAKSKDGVTEDQDLSVETLKAICVEQRFIIAAVAGMPVPDDPHKQLDIAVLAVIRSWMSERAVAYRNAHNLSHWQGTAVNVQAMVFGNCGNDSGTGVVFSHDAATGQPGLYGEFLPNAQGEDVVAGVRTPRTIEDMKEWAPSLYRVLERYVAMLAEKFGDIVEVEFTVEKGKLFLLQVRRAKRSPLAAVTFAVHQVWAGKWSRGEALTMVPERDVAALRERPCFDAVALRKAVAERPFAMGLAASPGVAIGHVALNKEVALEMAAAGKRVILVRRDTSPDDLPAMLVSAAVVTSNGGATSHAAVVARELGLPAIVGTNVSTRKIRTDTVVSVDGTSGVSVFGEVDMIGSVPSNELKTFLQWKDASMYVPTLRVEVMNEKMCVNTLLNDFYISDALAQDLRGTELGIEAVTLRNKTHREIAEFLAVYLAVAVAGELRHTYGQTRVKPRDVISELEKDFGLRYEEQRDIGQINVMTRLQNGTTSSHLRFFTLAERVFSEADWEASFGGDSWGAIAGTVRQFLDGMLSPTMFVDHVFDLEHNGGCLFDKHPMVTQFILEEALDRQLEAKKYARGIDDLYRCLKDCTDESGLRMLSGKVADLWQRRSDLKGGQPWEAASITGRLSV